MPSWSCIVEAKLYIVIRKTRTCRCFEPPQMMRQQVDGAFLLLSSALIVLQPVNQQVEFISLLL